MVPFPVKISAYAFIATWAIVYANYYPPENFLWTCNLGLLMTAVGLALNNRLVISVVLVIVALPDLGWALDLLFAAATGSHLFGGTEYMFDSAIPLGVRLLSFEHLLLTPFLIWLLWGRGYDARALWFAIVLLPVIYYLTYAVADPALEVNWVYGLFGKPQTLMAPGLYPLAAALLFSILLLTPTHLLAGRFISGSINRLDQPDSQ